MKTETMFNDRIDAAHKLASQLKKYEEMPGAILLAIPRGALEIGAVLRDTLNIPLDIVVTKKIGAPGNEEYAIGSVAPDGSAQLNQGVVTLYGIPPTYIQNEIERLQGLIKQRYLEYRGDSTPPDLHDKIVIVLDDGIATGYTTLAAVRYIRNQKPQKIVLAVPVAAADSLRRLSAEVDEVICLQTPAEFSAVGQFYRHFNQVEDSQAKALLTGKQDKNKK